MVRKINESSSSQEYAIMCVDGNDNIYYLTKNQKHTLWEKEIYGFPACIGSGYTTFKTVQATLNKFNKTIEMLGLESDDKYFLLTLNKVTKHSEEYGHDYETFELIDKKPIKFEIVGKGFDRHYNAVV